MNEQEKRMGIILNEDARERMRRYEEKQQRDAEIWAAVIFAAITLTGIFICLYVFRESRPQL